MKDFVEKINGRNYSIEEAKRVFIRYAVNHNAHISERAKNVIVKTYKNSLPKSSRAKANVNAEENIINMLKG